MPYDTTLHDHSARPRSHSPPAIEEGDSKKKRKVRTCYNCRRRKVQCDQAVPACGRCVKGGQAEDCVYLDDMADTLSCHVQVAAKYDAEPRRASAGAVTDHNRCSQELDSLLSRLEYQERRTKELEEELSSIRQGLTSGSEQTSLIPGPLISRSNITGSENPTELEKRLVKGKSFKTRFYGPSYPESLIAYIPGLAALSKEIAEESPILVKVRQNLRAIEAHTVDSRVTQLPITKQDLEALLPPRSEADELVQFYFESYDDIYHIIHRPSFRQEYEHLWSCSAQARPQFIALVLLMIAISRCLCRKEPWLYIGKNSVARDAALSSIQLCENWLRLQRQKNVTITDFQVRFLIGLAKAVTGTHFKRGWIETGTALRHCMAAGLHINDAALSKPTSILEKEMRRRVWFAMTEFELQTAFVRGMASDSLAQQSDTTPPNNIHDDDINSSTQNLPPQKPLTEFTSTSFLAMANTTYTFRHTLSKLLNARHGISFDEARDFTEQIEMYIREIPQWTESRLSEAPRALLQLNLRQYLLVLHNRRFQQATSCSSRNYSRMIIVDAAANVLDTHSALLAKGCHVLQLLCHDHLRAALSVCHVVGKPHPRSDCVINHSIDLYADRMMSDVVELIAGKVDRLGAGQQQLWIALVAKAFVKIQKDPKQKLTHTQEAVYRMTGSYYRIMACQGPTSTAQPAVTTHLPSGAAADRSIHAVQQGSEGSGGEFSSMNLDNISAWMLDEWSFESQDFQVIGNSH